MQPHSCAVLRYGPESDRNLFSRLHWPRGRSNFLDSKVINQGLAWDVDDLVLPPCAPEVLDGQGLIREVLPYRTSRFQSWRGCKSISVSRRSSGLPRALRNILNVATSLRMYAGAMLSRTGSQSVLVYRTAPVMVLMLLFSCMSTRLVCVEFLQIAAQYSATE